MRYSNQLIYYRLQADLDLNVIGVVDFMAAASGNHTIGVRNFRFNES